MVDEQDELAKARAAIEVKKNELRSEMDSIMGDMDDRNFVVLLDTIASIEQGPAKLILLEAAARLARKIGN
jgi:hypothetical protein